jgi:AcrR family transcriptional regulator
MGFEGMDRNGSDEVDERGAMPSPARPHVPVTQRERLLDGMARTVARRGYGATSVADVLRAARISRRTFYETFADKEDCFLAAYDEAVARCDEHVTAAYAGEEPWEARLARAVEAFLAFLAAEPEFARLGIVEVLAIGPRGLARRDATLGRFRRFIETSRGHLPATAPPSDLVAEAIAGGIYELVYARIARGEADRLPELLDDLLHYTFMLLGIPRRQGQSPR